MKEIKYIKEAYFYNITLAISIIFCLFIIGGCQEKEDTNRFSNFSFLSPESDLITTSTSELSENDLIVISEAFQRLSIDTKNGLFHINESSGSQINISEKLFTFFKRIESTTNARIKLSGNQYVKAIVESRKKEQGDTLQNDCVARTIIAIAKDLGEPLPLLQVTDWIERQFGKEGVPGSALSSVLDHFFTKRRITTLPTSYTCGDTTTRIFGVLKLSPNAGHAVIIINISNGFVLYRDDQNSNMNACMISEIGNAYIISEVNADIIYNL